MKKITLSFTLIIVLFVSSLFGQVNNEPKIKFEQLNRLNNYVKINSITPTVSLGLQIGITKFSDTGSIGSGFGVGMFAEIKTESFSIVPQANYWKSDKVNNFEMCGLARLRFSTGGMEPYVDGGIGVNFLNDKRLSDRNDTKLGLDLGGGLDFVGVGANYSIFFDAKYKIIVGDPNIKGFVLSGGIKFSL